MKEKKLKILFIECTGDIYGSGTSLINLTSKIKKYGFYPIIILPKKGTLSDSLEKLQIEYHIFPNLSIIRRKIINPRNFISFFFSLIPATLDLYRLIKLKDVDIIHTNSGVILNGGIAARISGLPHIWHIRESFSSFPKLLWIPFRQFILLFSTAIVCNSKATKDQFGRYSNSSKFKLIYNGIDTDWYDQAPLEHGAYKFKNGIHPDTLLIGTIGRISAIKGQEFLVKAIDRIRDKIQKPVIFLIVGDVYPGNERYKDSLNDLIRSLNLMDYIHLVGYLSDIRELLCDLDLVVVPTQIPEGFGNVVIEAMTASKPVIATKMGGPMEIIENDVTGFLVDNRDPSELSEAIIKLLNDDQARKIMGIAGRRRVEENFKLDKTIREVIILYRSIEERR